MKASESLSVPRVAITGGAGFLGSHITDYLIRNGFAVTCLDNLLTGNRENLRHLVDQPRFTFINQDVTVPFEVPGPLDFVLCFASPASPKDYSTYPIETMKAGSQGTYYALELARVKGAVFLLASTSEVYGDPKQNPQTEDYWGNVNPVGPRSVYDEAKRLAEAVSASYARQHHMDIRIARIFNCFGPRMRLLDGRAVPNFITDAIRNEPLTVFGDGSQTRSFCYVDDLVRGVFGLLTLGYRPSATANPLIVNLGNPEEMTILELAKLIIRLTRSRSSIKYDLLPENDPKVRCPNISKAQALLGWTPAVSTQEGLERTIPYFREQLSL